MSPAARERMLDGLRRHNPETLSAIARRSLTVTALKKALPVAAVVLLIALAMAPSWRAGPDANRVTYHVQATPGDSGGLAHAGRAVSWRGPAGAALYRDGENADQKTADLLALTSPVGDITLKSGAWLELKSDTGLFHQKITAAWPDRACHAVPQ